ncbi:unnamed protein product [Haemonchus placei]|uniref:DUF659 domain-containing protein n=1 Tax=Haemonchus placei TaxID=6290 RepID=A0A0N4X533_HAEPC|nr:unnamed protein product [Haemonchus placei]
MMCALLHATTRVCQSVGTWHKFEGHLALIGEAIELERARVDRMIWCIQHLHHTAVPFCVVSNFWAICRGEEPKEGYEQILLRCVTLMYPEYKDLIKSAKAAEGPNTIMFRQRLGLNRNKLTSVIMYLLCTSYAPNDDALNLYTCTNWRTEKRKGALNRLWRVMNNTEPVTKLFDGANVTDILPFGRSPERVCNEGPSPDNPAENQSEQEQPNGQKLASEDVTPEPDEVENDEARFLGADDPVDKGPIAPGYVAPTRKLPKLIHRKCRIYCDLPAEAMFCDSNRETKAAKVGGRMIATLTETEWPKLPGVMLGAPMSTKVDALQPHPSIVSVICSQYDTEWESVAHLMNRIFPVGLQISTAQKWFAFIHATVSRQCCTTSWVCVWLRWFDRYLVEKIRELDPNATPKTQVVHRPDYSN